LAVVACGAKPDAKPDATKGEPDAGREPDANGAILGTQECAMTADGGCSDPCFSVLVIHADLDAGCLRLPPIPVTCSKSEGGGTSVGCALHMETGELYLSLSAISLAEPYYHGWSSCTEEQRSQTRLPYCQESAKSPLVLRSQRR
jgi:hypothetical protein